MLKVKLVIINNNMYLYFVITICYKMEKKSMVLKDIPEDVYAELQRVQSEEKQKIKRQFSLEKCVYKIIKSTIKDKQ